MTKPNPQRGCVFCGRFGLTKEHLFRKSLADRIPASPGIAIDRIRPDGTLVRPRVEMPVSIFEREVRQVCAPCNHGWMDAIDNDVEDLLVDLATGHRQDIPAAKIAAMARWATRIALLRTLDDRGDHGDADPGLFHHFYQSRLPSPGTVIRVGLLPKLTGEGGSNQYSRAVPQDFDGAVSDAYDAPRLNLVTWGIGFLYAHVFLPSESLGRSFTDRIDAPNRPHSKMVPRLWPGRRQAIRFTTLMDPELIVPLRNRIHQFSG